MRSLQALFLSAILLHGFTAHAVLCGSLLGSGGAANPVIPRFGGNLSTHPVTKVANWMLDYVPREHTSPVQMALPVMLSVNDQQPQQFGDGVQNAGLSFGRFSSPPFVAVLIRRPGLSALTIKIEAEFPGLGQVTDFEVDILGERRFAALRSQGLLRLDVDCDRLGWNEMFAPKAVYFRPVGWNDWFAVAFPQAYVSIDTMKFSMAERYRTLPTGESIWDPLRLRGAPDVVRTLRSIPEASNLGFQFAEVGPRVHGVYAGPSGEQLTATGQALTRYRLPHTPDFPKLIYLLQTGRDLNDEVREGLVSGTGPHRIGTPATAEIIVNSIGSAPLMTFHGIPVPPPIPGSAISWSSDFSNLYVGTWLQPGMAFVASQGTYHQHLTHTVGRAVVAQVITPPVIPSPEAPFGFPRQ